MAASVTPFSSAKATALEDEIAGLLKRAEAGPGEALAACLVLAVRAYLELHIAEGRAIGPAVDVRLGQLAKDACTSSRECLEKQVLAMVQGVGGVQ